MEKIEGKENAVVGTRHELIFRDAKTGRLIEKVEVKNMLMNLNHNNVAKFWAKQSVTGCEVHAVGTGTGTLDSGRTSMFSELDRNVFTLATRENNKAIFETFFGASEAVGTLTEMAVFGNGATETPGSGDMYCHALISPSKAKTSNMTLTVRTEMTETSA